MSILERFYNGLSRAYAELEEERQIYQKWYSLIIADAAGREEYAFPFVDMLCGLTGVKSLQHAFSDAQRLALRAAIWTECIKDLMPYLTSPTEDPAQWQRLAEYYHAFQLLGPLTGTGAELGNYLLLCIALDRDREARDCAKTLLASVSKPEDDYVRVLLEYAEDHMSFPRFHTTFLNRSVHAWQTVSQSIEQYRGGEIDLDELSEQVRKVFNLWVGLPADLEILSPEEGEIAFPSDDWQLDLYSIRASIFAGLPAQPDHLKGYWSALIGPSSRYDKIHLADGTELNLSDIITAVVDSKAHNGAQVKIHCSALPQYCSYREAEDLFTHVIENILGVANFCINVRKVDYVRSMSRKPTGTLDTLVEQLEAAGYPCGHEIDDVAPLRMYRTYTRDPSEGSGPRLRDDIRTGDTICWPLQDDYENNRVVTADRYMNRGIAPVFLAWPRSIMDCDEETYTQRLIDVLREGNIPLNVQILGKASGTQYCYLDLLAWSPMCLVEAVEKYLSRMPGGKAFRIQSFYYDAYPCPISMARAMEHCELTASPRSAKSSAVRPKEKKKNAAKARRKHSKRHR